MPELHEVSYSREATIAAFRDFYQFLTKFYMSEDEIEEPPADGWPTITNERVHYLGKNDEVGELMRHLPYIKDENLLAPHAAVAHWPNLFKDYPTEYQLSTGMGPVEGVRILAENLEWEHVPSSAFGISIGHDTYILDTRLGIVHCTESPIRVEDVTVREAILDDFWDLEPESEHGWRCSGPAYAIADFFEVMKQRYRDLLYLPMNAWRLEEWFDEYEDGHYRPVLRDVRQIFKEHGWPDLSVYNKEKCMKAVEKLIEEQYPDEEGW
jgi:hypothetical protein